PICAAEHLACARNRAEPLVLHGATGVTTTRRALVSPAPRRASLSRAFKSLAAQLIAPRARDGDALGGALHGVNDEATRHAPRSSLSLIPLWTDLYVSVLF